MFTYNCLNPISDKGLVNFSTDYKKVENISDADVALVRSAAMHDMEFGTKLKCIARAGAGVNNIPLDKCAEEGIVVFNTPGANANGVKELVFAGMLLASRDIVGGINWVLENKDDENVGKTAEKAKKAFAGTEIAGKKLGVIGLGAIGVKVANDANRLGMEVLGYDPYISVNAAWNLSRNVRHATTVEEIYKECDFITIHVPLMDNTKGMINKEAVQMMKKGVVILNYARDLLVDEAAVMNGIESGKIRHYVTDFANPTVAGAKGVICTPHLGASTEEAEDNCAVMAVNEVMDYMENGNISHSVNYPDCNMGICTAEGRVAILHKNKAGLIASFTTLLSKDNINVEDMTNKSRGDYAYTLLDLGTKLPDSVLSEIEKIDGVIKVRVVK